MHMRPLDIYNKLLNFKLNLFLRVFSWYFSIHDQTKALILPYYGSKSLKNLQEWCMLIENSTDPIEFLTERPECDFFGQKWKSPKCIFRVFRGPVLENYWKLRDQMGHLPLRYIFRLPHFYHQSVGGGVSELIEKSNPSQACGFFHSRHPITLSVHRGTKSVTWEPILA